jgi:hypothetical protein
MPRSGHRHHLVLYTYMLNRWWKSIFGLGVVLLMLAAGLGGLPGILPQNHFLVVSDTALWVVGGTGAYAILLAFILIVIRKSAYVQPFDSYLRLATPFLHMNIGYRRIRKATSVDMQHLFHIERFKGWRRKLLLPLAGQTAIVLDMTGWPLPRWTLRLFLSPFFFPDNTPRLALLVPRWMEFSNEMESFRGAWLESQRQTSNTPQSDLLASISRSRR